MNHDLAAYIRAGLDNDRAAAEVAMGRFVMGGGTAAEADAALIAVAKQPQHAATPKRAPKTNARKWLTDILLAIVIPIVVLLIVRAVYTFSNDMQPPAAEQVAPTTVVPDVKINTNTGAITRPAQPAPVAPTHPFVLPAGTQGTWAPAGEAVADIGGRQYREIAPGFVELDDGTRVWLVEAQPAAVPPVTAPAASAAPQADEAASWVVPVQELVERVVAPEPQADQAAQWVQPVAPGGTAAGAGKGLGSVADYLRRTGK